MESSLIVAVFSTLEAFIRMMQYVSGIGDVVFLEVPFFNVEPSFAQGRDTDRRHKREGICPAGRAR